MANVLDIEIFVNINALERTPNLPVHFEVANFADSTNENIKQHPNTISHNIIQQ